MSRLLAEVERLLRKGDHALAYRKLQQIYGAAAHDSKAQRVMGDMLESIDEFAEAYSWYQSAVSHLSTDVSLWADMARCAHAGGDHEASVKSWCALFELDPTFLDSRPTDEQKWSESRRSFSPLYEPIRIALESFNYVVCDRVLHLLRGRSEIEEARDRLESWEGEIRDPLSKEWLVAACTFFSEGSSQTASRWARSLLGGYVRCDSDKLGIDSISRAIGHCQRLAPGALDSLLVALTAHSSNRSIARLCYQRSEKVSIARYRSSMLLARHVVVAAAHL